jgi:DNA-binding MarR family transcriptional regulator
MKITSLRNFEYENRTREYLPGHKTYKREADFLEIVGKESRTMTEISKMLNVSQGAATQLAIRVEKKGLVIREEDMQDRRRLNVNQTSLGEKLDEAHRQYENKFMEKLYDLLDEFSEEEIKKFTVISRKMGDVFDYFK